VLASNTGEGRVFTLKAVLKMSLISAHSLAVISAGKLLPDNLIPLTVEPVNGATPSTG
jgi:hypothetical protein